MAHEVVVVGGGIGGLTLSALLAARGVDVCLFERQEQVGGCVAKVEKFGYVFEPTLGLYTGWAPDEIHHRIFAELPVGPPETRPVNLVSPVPSEFGLSSQNVFAIRGGAAALAERLSESIKRSGGSVRLNSPVLRLSYDSQGSATGVDLLSGENVRATRAIVSNMTVWDTYGKLIGLQRTPSEIKKRLASLRSSGAFLIFAGLDDAAAARLPADHLFISTNEPADSDSLIDISAFAFAATPDWDPRAPEGKRAATILFRADVDQWFTYQADLSEQEEREQVALEIAWRVLHEHMPELGSDIEIIETATPQTYYDLTRRKLGMVGTPIGPTMDTFDHRTSLPNVFMIGDTVSSVSSLAAVSQSALTLANMRELF